MSKLDGAVFRQGDYPCVSGSARSSVGGSPGVLGPPRRAGIPLLATKES